MVDFAKKVQNKGAEFLLPGEQVIAAVPWQKTGSFGKQMAFGSAGLIGAAVYSAATRDKKGQPEGSPPAEVLGAKPAIVALTDQRLVAFAQSAMSGNPKSVLGEWPRDQVAGVELEKKKVTTRVTLSFTDGSFVEGEVIKAAKPEPFAEAIRSIAR
jgi:hypothetical protein